MLISLLPGQLWAWGDLGHEVVAAIALDRVRPVTRTWVEALLRDDPDPLTAHDPVASAVWADRHREDPSNGPRVNYQQTHRWHFIDLDRNHPSWQLACPNPVALPPTIAASQGPADDCIVTKLIQFHHELEHFRGATLPGRLPFSTLTGQQRREARLALKYLLHFMGDLHQPLHAIDDHDRGGNDKRVTLPGAYAGTLHHYWDSTFVIRLLDASPGGPARNSGTTEEARRGGDARWDDGPRLGKAGHQGRRTPELAILDPQLGPDPAARRLATKLETRISPSNVRAWEQGDFTRWAQSSWNTAKNMGYDPLPIPDEHGRYRLDRRYANLAQDTVAVQLEMAGVRLAWTLDQLNP